MSLPANSAHQPTSDEQPDEAITCEYGGCTVEAPCVNHLAFRTLPKSVKADIAAHLATQVAAARKDELRMLDRNDDEHVLLTDAGLRYFMARWDYLAQLQPHTGSDAGEREGR